MWYRLQNFIWRSQPIIYWGSEWVEFNFVHNTYKKVIYDTVFQAVFSTCTDNQAQDGQEKIHKRKREKQTCDEIDLVKKKR